MYLYLSLQSLSWSYTKTDFFFNFLAECVALEECAFDRERTSENPLLLKLKDIIITRYTEEANMRAIVFVRTRILANILASWMDSTKELQHIKARKYTGAQAHNIDGGG
jgi:ERCC4-related helicase